MFNSNGLPDSALDGVVYLLFVVYFYIVLVDVVTHGLAVLENGRNITGLVLFDLGTKGSGYRDLATGIKEHQSRDISAVFEYCQAMGHNIN